MADESMNPEPRNEGSLSDLDARLRAAREREARSAGAEGGGGGTSAGLGLGLRIGVERAMATCVEVHHDEKGIVWPVRTAAGRLPMSTVGAPGGMSSSGSAGCGTGVGTGAGGWMGAWQCGVGWSTWSVTRAAGGI